MEREQLIQTLLDPATYPHDCDPIRLVETHISWVFLTGAYAYKVKKPVDFGFLDFSSLEKRRHFCQEEVARNQVFSPDLYVGVVGLGIQDGKGALTDDLDQAQEYLVKMKQFPEENLLSMLVAANDFDDGQALSLGGAIANLHERIAVVDPAEEWGTATAVGYPIEENFEQIQPLVTDEDENAKLDALKKWSESQLTKHAELFQTRKDSGFVKACHGDLHLNNILWLNGHCLPFDCIEFNDAFRWIDVISELAFLLMDLEHQGEFSLAVNCLNGYLEESGDYDGLALLRFYKVYRAMVRAKVAILRLQQPDLAEDTSIALRKEFSSYLDLALDYIQETTPCLYITHGVSGSGKTTMSRFVAGRVGAVHVRSDVERKRLYGLKPQERSQAALGDTIYSKDASRRTFARLEDLASQLLRCGYSVIVDATFLRRNLRQVYEQLAKDLQVPFAILDCAIDEETARKRVKERVEKAQDASEADLKVLESQLSDQDYLSLSEQRNVVVIDMGKPLESIDLESLIRREVMSD